MTTQTKLSKSYIEHIASYLNSFTLEGEMFVASYSAENSLFVRISQSKVRQPTIVEQGTLSLKYIYNNKTINVDTSISGNEETDELRLKKFFEYARRSCLELPDDPYLTLPDNNAQSSMEHSGRIPEFSELIEKVLNPAAKVDLAGVLSAGRIVRASFNSLGQFHWFKTENFTLDYSLYNEKQKAVKSLYAGTDWNQDEYEKDLKQSIEMLNLMNTESKEIPRGEYRVYLAPSAVSELLGMMQWSGFSAGAFKRGESGLAQLHEKKKNFSPKINIIEDFSLGLTPRFNDLGEEADLKLSLVEKGQLLNALTSTRTAKEFQLKSNFANDWEGGRSIHLTAGNLSDDKILSTLSTGLYISDLHYLNWSDRQNGRVTGMTRYACFWVENGRLISPIKDLRFDESLYHVFGDGLVELTEKVKIAAQTSTYEKREIGGFQCPGMIVDGFKFTL